MELYLEPSKIGEKTSHKLYSIFEFKIRQKAILGYFVIFLGKHIS